MSFVGYGPARIGMTRKELEQAIGSKLVGQYPDADEMGCDYVAPETGHDALSFMLVNERLVRIDVSSSGVKTISGAQVGDAQDSVLALYRDRIQITPHHYTAPDGSYLTMYSPNRKYGMRFETDHGVVTTYYAGTAEAIQYVEGCL
ncbi:hypothetical protein [Lysobacter solisilvae (ex Woo and Kim 2020)]|uniref:Uncharacterized protein n=1 Tax=Agrilutibacter terrestris TaxID=2865112 RepID=A0A7H0FVV7_9GAMM|nr:hypothetical protein [Lysobacter terrestris]QNP40173.1 hypothetical protein H8B22_11835 [Lysobacter terrestris]